MTLFYIAFVVLLLSEMQSKFFGSFQKIVLIGIEEEDDVALHACSVNSNEKLDMSKTAISNM